MIETERLLLRNWREADREPFHAMSRDPRVMATLGPLTTRSESDAVIDRMMGYERAHGHTFWALERRSDGMFLGWCGLIPGAAGTPMEGGVEIGWRLAGDQWGQGYATEAARGSVHYAWSELNADSVGAITAAINTRSQAVMERLGMVRSIGEDFDHPRVPEGDPLRRHVTYRIDRPD